MTLVKVKTVVEEILITLKLYLEFVYVSIASQYCQMHSNDALRHAVESQITTRNIVYAM